jgi:hypothetical protein
MAKNATGDQPINPAQAVLALAIIVFGIFGSMTIWAELPKGETWQYWVAGVSGVFVLVFSVIVFLQSRRKDLCPDLLAALPISPYECEGVLLVPVFSPLPIRPGGTVRQIRVPPPSHCVLMARLPSSLLPPGAA